MGESATTTVRYLPLDALALLNRFLLEPIAVLAAAAMMAVIAGNAVLRSLFDQPIQWALPLVTGLLMPVVVFAGALGVTLHDRHVRMELLYARLGTTGRAACRFVGWTTAVAFLGPAAYANVRMAQARIDDAALQEFTVPASLQFFIVAVSTALLATTFTAFFARPIRTVKRLEASEKSRLNLTEEL